MEDPNDFFNSSPGAKSVATTAGGRSTIKKASRQDYAAYRYDEEDDAAYDGEGAEVQDEEGGSATPADTRHGPVPRLTLRLSCRRLHLASDVPATTPLCWPRPFGPPSLDLGNRRTLRLAQGSLLAARQRSCRLGQQVPRLEEAVVQLRGRRAGRLRG